MQKITVFTCFLPMGLLLISLFRSLVFVPATPVEDRDQLKVICEFEIQELQTSQSGPKARPVNLITGDDLGGSFSVCYYPVLPWGLDVNRADGPVLTLIRGIGPSKATRILQDRKVKGPFKDMADFQRRAGVRLNKFVLESQWIYAGE